MLVHGYTLATGDDKASKNARRRERDRARRTAMSPVQKELINKKRREQYAAKTATKKAAKQLRFTPHYSNETSVVNNTLDSSENNGGGHMESTSIAQDGHQFLAMTNTFETDENNSSVLDEEQFSGEGNENSPSDHPDKRPNQRGAERLRAWRNRMSAEKKELINKRRREEYA
ncbi:unnamed protein product, partial [Urochloa humidicola]